MGWTPAPLNGIKVPDWMCLPPVTEEKESTMKLLRVGVDLAKNVIELHEVDPKEKPVWRYRLPRKKWRKVLCETAEPGCAVPLGSSR